MLIDFYELLKGSAIVMLLLFVINYRSQSFLFVWGRRLFIVFFLVTVFSIIFKWVTKRYAVDDQAFYIQSGMFNKTERTVYFQKIQNVQRRTTFVHKLFGMTSITFETGIAGMLDSGVEFEAVTKQEADRLEALLKNLKTDEASEEEEAESVPERVIHFTPQLRDIVKATFTSFSFLVLIAVAASIFSKLDTMFGIEDQVEGWISSVFTSGWIIAAIITVFVGISIVAGFIYTYVRYGKYEIASDEDRIMIRQGVIDETAFSILKSRVQAIEITQPLLKRILGLAEVKLISAGGVGDGSEEISTLYPFLPVKRAYSIIGDMLPGYEILQETKRLPAKALVVRLIKPYWFWLVVTAVLVYFRPEPFGWQWFWWAGSLLLLVWIVALRIIDFFNTQYAITDGFIQTTEGAFEKKTFLSRRDKILEISVKRTKFQQWSGLATIGLINRAKPVRHEMLKDVPLTEADRFYSWYAGRLADVRVE